MSELKWGMKPNSCTIFMSGCTPSTQSNSLRMSSRSISSFSKTRLPPEDLEWFANMRQQCCTPIAMGELFNNPREWQPLIAGRLIDFIRMHVSQMGGLTPARHVAAFANMYGVRTAWHGPGDTSPVGHAANLHLDLWAPNFGIQEWCNFP